MLRSVLAAIGGYVVIVVVVMAGIGLAWVVLGGTGAFEGDGPAPSTLWMLLNIATGLVAAMAGGWVARKIGRSSIAVNILIGLILVVGVYYALTAESSHAKRDPVDKPVAEMSFTEAGQHAEQPAWYNWVIPLIGASGAFLGGRKRSQDSA